MADRTTDPKCYIARCKCGGIAAVDDPDHPKDTARSVAEVIQDGFAVERVELDVARTGKWCTKSKEHMRG